MTTADTPTDSSSTEHIKRHLTIQSQQQRQQSQPAPMTFHLGEEAIGGMFAHK